MAEAVVEARGVDKTYGQGEAAVHVLKSLDLTLGKGEFCVVLGPSGSGKSTLLNMLGLMDRPGKGDVVFSGQSTRELDETRRAGLRGKHLGFIFQFDSLLPEFTMLENVLMPWRIGFSERNRSRGWKRFFKSVDPEEADPLDLAVSGTQEAWNAARDYKRAKPRAEQRAVELLRSLGLERLKDRFPAQASGGERQRVAICRALINSPTVLLADEPTGNLDKTNGEMVFSDLKSLAEKHGVAVVMVTHNESACGYAHRTLTMQDGAIVEEVHGK